MKKFFASVLACMMLFAVSVTAYAAPLEGTSQSNVIVEYSNEELIATNNDVVDDGYGYRDNGISLLASQDYDLGTSDSINMTISNFLAGQSRYSDYNYKTNSTKIKIAMKSNISISVRVTLYDSSNNSQVGQQTVTVGTLLNTSVTFTNLSSSKTYNIKYENLGQQDVNITGTISAS